jgi:serine/threonine-protein kinase
MDDEAAEIEREYQEEKARERAEAEKLVGTVIGAKYRVDAFVGGGAMGKVYRATQLLLDKTVAVKVLHAGLGQDEKFQSRFHREAKSASKLDHPNSVAVIDFGIDRDGMMFIVMEYLAGRDLFAALRKEWPFSTERTVEVMSQVLSALAVAHEHGIVHRDLKPENIMIVPKKQDDGTLADVVKVADFGIAKIMDSHRTGANGERLSTAGNIAGTPEYMSPEQAQASNIDGRADLYSCGVILYEMCTGKLPFSAETPIGVVLKHITEQPAPPSTINPAISAEMERVIMKSLSKSPADRYPDARSMRAALRATLGIRDTTSTGLSAAAMSAIAAIEAAEGVGQASTMVGVPAPAVVVPEIAPTPARNETVKAMVAPPVNERTPSGPKGERTHSTTTSHEVPVVTEAPAQPAAPAPAPAGISKGTLVSSIIAAVSIGALAVIGISQRNTVNGETRAASQQPANTPPVTAQTPAPNTNAQPNANVPPTNTVAQANGNEPTPSGDAPPSNTPTPNPTPTPTPTQNPTPDRAARAGRTTTGTTASERPAAQNTVETAPTPAANNSAPNPTPTVNTQPAANTQPAQAVVAPTTQPVAQPTPTIAPLNGVRGTAGRLSASGGVLVNRLQGRAQTAADAIGRCALQQARASRAGDSFTAPIDVTLNISVADRRLDRLRLLGGPSWLHACGREAEPAFSGDLPEADDPEYTITLAVSLSPQR